MKITCRKVGKLVHCEVTCDGMAGPITYLHQFHGVSMRQAKDRAKAAYDNHWLAAKSAWGEMRLGARKQKAREILNKRRA